MKNYNAFGLTGSKEANHIEVDQTYLIQVELNH